MQFIPKSVVSKLYNRTSLRNDDGIVRFSVKNRLSPATLREISQLAINGNSVKTAEIDFVEVAGDSTGDVPVTYLKYKLDGVFIKSWSISGDADDRPTEEVSFYYNKIAFAYTPEGEEVPKPVHIMSWDNVKNIPWDVVFDPIRELLFPSGQSK